MMKAQYQLSRRAAEMNSYDSAYSEGRWSLAISSVMTDYSQQ